MITDEQMAWVAVTQCPGIGLKRFELLLAYLDSVNVPLLEFWQLSQKDFLLLELPEKLKVTVLAHKNDFVIEKVKEEFITKNISICTTKDYIYPTLLKEITDPPPVLFVQGVLKEHFTLPIAVVGTRKVTSYGRMVTKLLSTELVKQGAEIISGFMYGVDAIAHQAAIDQGGYTVGVLGYGFDFLYPTSHSRLKEHILHNGGVLLSEYIPSTPPIVGQFPQRNRIVSGMSKGVLVTEAAVNSGSKITARLAAEYGRDVFAVPGPIMSPYSEGTKDLVNSGAKLVTGAKDILEEYYPQRMSSSQPINLESILQIAENETEKMILELLVQQSFTSDDICSELQIESRELLSALSLLEMKGIVGLEGGKYFVRF